MIISPFIINVDANNITLGGPIITDYSKRESEQHYINEVIDKIKNIRSKSIIICEAYLPKIELMLQMKKQQLSNFVQLTYSLSYDSLKTYVEAKNINIFYLKNVRDQTLKIHNYDIETLGGKEL